jgi:hypothetical protein
VSNLSSPQHNWLNLYEPLSQTADEDEALQQLESLNVHDQDEATACEFESSVVIQDDPAAPVIAALHQAQMHDDLQVCLEDIA